MHTQHHHFNHFDLFCHSKLATVVVMASINFLRWHPTEALHTYGSLRRHDALLALRLTESPSICRPLGPLETAETTVNIMGENPYHVSLLFVVVLQKIQLLGSEGVLTTASGLGFHTTDTALGDYALSKKQHQAKIMFLKISIFNLLNNCSHGGSDKCSYEHHSEGYHSCCSRTIIWLSWRCHHTLWRNFSEVVVG